MAGELAGSTRIKPVDLSTAEKLRNLPWGLLLLVASLGAIGYLTLYSAGGGSSQPWAARHAARLGLGLIVVLAVALTDIRAWFKYAYWIFGLSLMLLVAVEVAGEVNKGAERWINLGFMQLQPSELAKITLVLALARYFHGSWLEDVGRPAHLAVPLLMIALPAGLVLKQPDLGTAVILGGVGVSLLFLSGVRWWKFALAGALAAAAAPVAWAQLHDYQKQRVMTFLDPSSDPLGSGYHIIQSKIALGSGGLWGQGFLQGSQAQLSFLPEKQTDFAFTMIAEETGFVGAVLVLALFFGVLMYALKIALRSNHQFGRLLATGIGVNLFCYVVINVAMVTGLIPVVGVPLPLISYGGTVVMTTAWSVGLLLAIDVNRHVNIPRFPVDL